MPHLNDLQGGAKIIERLTSDSQEQRQSRPQVNIVLDSYRRSKHHNHEVCRNSDSPSAPSVTPYHWISRAMIFLLPGI